MEHPSVSVLGKPFAAATLLEHTKRMIGPPVLPERDPAPPRLPTSRRRA